MINGVVVKPSDYLFSSHGIREHISHIVSASYTGVLFFCQSGPELREAIPVSWIPPYAPNSSDLALILAFCALIAANSDFV
jgi:hypothetical protein